MLNEEGRDSHQLGGGLREELNKIYSKCLFNSMDGGNGGNGGNGANGGDGGDGADWEELLSQ